MRLFSLVKKELIEISRQRELLPLMFIAPLVQIIMLGYVVRTDIHHIALALQDEVQSEFSRTLTRRISASPLFELTHVSPEPFSATELFKTNQALAVVRFKKPRGSDHNPLGAPQILIDVDGVDANTSAVAAGYLGGLIRKELDERIPKGLLTPVEAETLIRYNPDLESINTMGPGIVALLLTILTLFLTSVSLVREREQQTIDTLLISPLTPLEIYLGKALPMAIIGLLQMSLGLLVVKLWFGIPFRGSLLWLLAAAVLFLSAILAYALLISTMARTQQQALFFSWFSMITFILLSGLFTPTESMAPLIQKISMANPLRHLIQIIRDILLKGNGWLQIRDELAILGLIALVILTLSALSFKRLIRR